MSARKDDDSVAGSVSATSYALLTDGTCVAIRPAVPRDWQAVHDFAEALGPDSVYHRFFSLPARPGALLAVLGVPMDDAAAAGGDAVVTAWQDPVFGPLITCAAHGSGGSSRTLLAPASLRDLQDLAQAATGRPAPALVDLLARIAILIDACLDVASARLDVSTGDDVVSVVGGEVAVIQAHRVDPYLWRLRRAPVE